MLKATFQFSVVFDPEIENLESVADYLKAVINSNIQYDGTDETGIVNMDTDSFKMMEMKNA